MRSTTGIASQLFDACLEKWRAWVGGASNEWMCGEGAGATQDDEHDIELVSHFRTSSEHELIKVISVITAASLKRNV